VDVLKSDIKLNINTDKSRTLGIQTADIDKTVRLSIAGLNVGKYTDNDGDDYDIMLNAPKEQFASLNSFDNIFVNNAIGTPVPLKQVAELEFESSPSTIKHLDKKRFVVVTAFTDKGVLTEQVTNEFLNRASQLQLPLDIRCS
jgi:multidrug efflux pump subunit AcrB